LKRIDLDLKELEALIERTRGALSPEEYEKLQAALRTLEYLTELVEDRNTTIGKLRQILFGARTEKTRKVLQEASGEPDSQKTSEQGMDETGRFPIGVVKRSRSLMNLSTPAIPARDA
jgi:hypothetical protein